jgi:GPI-anchor transamidase subunit GAA1
MPPPSSSIAAGFRSIQLPTALVNPSRIRSYLLRLPLFTRFTVLGILLCWILELQTVWSVIKWGSLQPSQIGIFSGGMYRLNTFVFVHLGFFHMLFNLICLVPLMERFEAEFGTLVSLALFMGPLATIPAGLYLLIEYWILRGDTEVVGSSIWIFMLLAAESIKTWKQNPYLTVADVKIPTWIWPIVLCIVTSILIPGTSFLGHVCGLVTGYACKPARFFCFSNSWSNC